MNKYFFTICLLLFTTIALAQTNTDTVGMSPIKTMSYKQYKAYIDGVDLSNMAAVAELNHYPDPQKTVNWKKELALSPAQISNVSAINTELQRKTKEMGALIIKNETTLDNLFRSKKIDDGSLIFYGQRTDLFKGELRNAILQAYVKVEAILTPAQHKKYQQLQKVDR